MNKLILKAPLNSTSLGNVSLNILKELYKKDFQVAIFPHRQNVDLSVYDLKQNNFSNWLQQSIDNRNKIINKDIPTLQVWHIYGSAEERCSSKSFLYTFYELDSPTFSEVNICNSHDKVMFSSNFARESFSNNGVNNASYVPLGFDEDFNKTGKTYLENTIHFGLMGKFEKRKHTARILKLWAERFGNKDGFELSCAISNPFISNEQMNHQISESLNGEYYSNINFVPYMPSNQEVNSFMNAIDIDLTGLSGGEGWNLPSFNCSCLGKWSCVLNSSSHKDWANEKNSAIIDPDSKEPAYDGIFFKQDAEVNQGNIFNFTEDSFNKVVDKALESHKQGENTEGLKLRSLFSYEKCVDNILSNIF